MLFIGMLATTIANRVADHRARRLARPRPRLIYLFTALGCVLAAAASWLLAKAAGAAGGGLDLTGDSIVAWLGWFVKISTCAGLMMIGRALTAGSVRRPAWLPPSNHSGAVDATMMSHA